MVTLIPKNISPFKLVYYSLKYFGFICYRDRPWSWICTAYHWFIISSFGICSILEVFLGSGAFRDVIEAVSGFAVFVMTIAKLYNFLFKGKEIRSLLERLEKLRNEILIDPENVNIVNNAKDIVEKLVILLGAFVITNPILSFIKSTTVDYQTNFKNKRFFLMIWVPWSIENVWPYIAGKIFATLIGESNVLINFAFSIIHFTFAFQMSAYLRILQRYLETNGPADRMIYQQHKIMIQLIQEYKDIFSGQMFLETLVDPILPCGYGLALIRDIRQNELNQLDTIQKISCCLLPPFIVCTCVQMISTQVEKLHEASYMSTWYEEKPKVRQDLLMLMQTTTKPTTINYRLLFPLDHQCLANVVQGIYSFFMLVINFDHN